MDKGIPWNMNELDTILKLGLATEKMSGVTSAYIYAGGWKTMFGWHKEDLDLYSINYLHHGAPKYWYSVDLESNLDFENLARDLFKDAFASCSDYLRHKNTLIHPSVLLKHGIKLRKTVQRPGQFVISRASAYHAGFNSGFNIAEAVNFTLKSWIYKHALNVTYCTCIEESVKFNFLTFFKSLISQSKKLDRRLERFVKEKIK